MPFLHHFQLCVGLDRMEWGRNEMRFFGWNSKVRKVQEGWENKNEGVQTLSYGLCKDSEYDGEWSILGQIGSFDLLFRLLSIEIYGHLSIKRTNSVLSISHPKRQCLHVEEEWRVNSYILAVSSYVQIANLIIGKIRSCDFNSLLRLPYKNIRNQGWP